MSLADIYVPVGEDLARVEARLKEVSREGSPWLAELQGQIFGSGGKRIRPALVLLAAKSFNYNLDACLPMAAAVEVLHVATLVHDDAIDHSPRRRGLPTVNEVWGEDKAILFGDYLLARAEALVADTGNLRVVKSFAQAIMTLAAGEISQSFSAFDLKQTPEQYFSRISAKTGSLISLATESGAGLGKAPEAAITALKEYGLNLGIAFQIADDILDFIGNEAEMGKPAGSDLSEGTLTLPARLVLERYPGDNPLRKLFEEEKHRAENLKPALELVRGSGVIEECYQVASDYAARAVANLEVLPEGPARRSFQELATYVVRRKK